MSDTGNLLTSQNHPKPSNEGTSKDAQTNTQVLESHATDTQKVEKSGIFRSKPSTFLPRTNGL
jgi:hypothetical protein